MRDRVIDLIVRKKLLKNVLKIVKKYLSLCIEILEQSF